MKKVPLHSNNKAGFTLMELAVVIFIIGLSAAILYPQLMPLITWGELEGSARHLAGYGRAAIAHATMMKQEITVRIDLNEQHYSAVMWVYPEPEEMLDGEPDPDQFALLGDMKSKGYSTDQMAEAIAQDRDSKGGGKGMLGEFDDEMANDQLTAKFDRFSRQILEARAKNVKHDESLLEDIGDIFEEEFSLDEEKNEPEELEVDDPILERTRIESGLRIEDVKLEEITHRNGFVEVKLSPLGLQERVLFHLVNKEEQYYTVFWNPVRGSAEFKEGRLAYDDFE